MTPTEPQSLTKRVNSKFQQVYLAHKRRKKTMTLLQKQTSWKWKKKGKDALL
jgi:hypothetical protein